MGRAAQMTEVTGFGPIFRWETLREVGTHALRYLRPIPGRVFEVELVSGPKIEVWRGDDGVTYFCHGLTFGGKEAPGGPVSPFSDHDVMTIVRHHFDIVQPHSAAAVADILVWQTPAGETPHSAVLVESVVIPGRLVLDYGSKLQTKNGIEPETTMTLEQLVKIYYGETYKVYRRK
jgi:hypothetical protein